MKMKPWLILFLSFSAGFAIQPVFSQTPPVIPAEAPTNAPSKSLKKKKATEAKAKAAALAEADKAPAALAAPEPAVVKQNNVNVRGKADINSEIVLRLKKGDAVTILEEVTLKKPKTDEPAKWVRIALPTNAAVWVSSHFIDPTSKAVIPKKLNVRSGPSENYNVVGRIEKGRVVKEIEAKGDWLKIEAPEDAYAFVAAHLLSKEPAPTVAPPAIAKVEPVPPPTIPKETELVVVPPPVPAGELGTTPVAPVNPIPVPSPETPAPTTPPVVLAPVTPPTSVIPPPEPQPVEEALVKRVVSREGFVRRSVSIQAPTFFVLESLRNGRTINYLYSPTTNMVLKDFQGKRIVVTGEELLDERWPNTPVINVESLEPVP